MKDFISLAACKGHAPVRISRTAHPRPHLINRLLRNRNAMRIVCAPDGFGKTTLAAEYAETMFGYEGVFWLDGTSPCLLRDIDDGHLAEKVLTVDKAARLVVVNHMPRLEGGRAERFLRAARALLAAGCEVLITCTPGVAARFTPAFGAPSLEPRDLCLDDTELAEFCEANLLGPGDELGRRMLRVPALSWGAAEEPERGMLASLAAEGLTRQELAVCAAALLLGRGPVELLETLSPGAEEGDAVDVLADLAVRYPIFAMDDDRESFITPEFSPKGIVKALRSRLDDAASVPGSAAMALLEQAATLLLYSGAGERAAEVAACMPQAPARISWLVRHQSELMEGLLFLPACRVYDAIGTALTRNPLANRLRLGQALRLAMLGRPDHALAEVRTVESSTAASPDMRLIAAMVKVWFGPLERQRQAKAALRDALATTQDAENPGGIARLAKMLTLTAEMPAELLRLRLGCWLAWYKATLEAAGEERPPAAPQAALEAAPDVAEAFLSGEHGRLENLALMLGAFVLARAAGDRAEAALASRLGRSAETRIGSEAPELRAGMLAVRDFLVDLLAGRGEGVFTFDGHLTFSSFVAVSALVSLEKAGVPESGLSSALMAAFRRTEARLDGLRREAGEAYGSGPVRVGGAVLPYRPRKEASANAASFDSAHTAPQLGTWNGAAPLRPFETDDSEGGTPRLFVRLLGSCEVWAGNHAIETREFARQKVKVLLAILTLHAGQELTREQLTSELWPNSYSDVAARSFYNVWGKLKRILSTPGGECPYLIRLQNGYCLENRLVRSDVARVLELARIFLLGRVDSSRWLELLDEFEELYRGELLPSECNSVMIQAYRVQFRRKAIDALIGASSRLLAEGERDAALLFAYAAFQRERQREDVYLALMRAQLACDQRTSAVDTYFACREMLSEGLGLDPSRNMMDLYLSILNDDVPAARAAL